MLEPLLGPPIDIVADNVELGGGLRLYAAPPDSFPVALSTHGWRRARGMGCGALPPLGAMWGA